MGRKLLIIGGLSLLGIIIFIQRNSEVTPIFKYFPIDHDVYFTENKTSLQFTEDNSLYCLHWQGSSVTNADVYLRQDVNLLFANGSLIAIKNIWKENDHIVSFAEDICSDRNTYFQAIGFSHGENHRQHEITSTFTMSHDYAIALRNHTNEFSFYHKNDLDNSLADQVTAIVNDKVSSEFNDLLTYFNIDKGQYISIPIVNLNTIYLNNGLPVPNRTEQQILGQLWEGLYSNYIIPSITNNTQSGMPFILFSNDFTHLIVVFNLDKEPQKLIQQYPNK